LTHHIAKGKPGTIEITHGGPVTGITKGKNGHLMVVSKFILGCVITHDGYSTLLLGGKGRKGARQLFK
jgi:hypothetical protein